MVGIAMEFHCRPTICLDDETGDPCKRDKSDDNEDQPDPVDENVARNDGDQ